MFYTKLTKRLLFLLFVLVTVVSCKDKDDDGDEVSCNIPGSNFSLTESFLKENIPSSVRSDDAYDYVLDVVETMASFKRELCVPNDATEEEIFHQVTKVSQEIVAIAVAVSTSACTDYYYYDTEYSWDGDSYDYVLEYANDSDYDYWKLIKSEEEIESEKQVRNSETSEEFRILASNDTDGFNGCISYEEYEESTFATTLGKKDVAIGGFYSLKEKISWSTSKGYYISYENVETGVTIDISILGEAGSISYYDGVSSYDETCWGDGAISTCDEE